MNVVEYPERVRRKRQKGQLEGISQLSAGASTRQKLSDSPKSLSVLGVTCRPSVSLDPTYPSHTQLSYLASGGSTFYLCTHYETLPANQYHDQTTTQQRDSRLGTFEFIPPLVKIFWSCLGSKFQPSPNIQSLSSTIRLVPHPGLPS